ncbi:hypothetical protein [Saccharopolyspora gregorii]|nr:hypothetical protein [Saccharopolyspora gregorii]
MLGIGVEHVPDRRERHADLAQPAQQHGSLHLALLVEPATP